MVRISDNGKPWLTTPQKQFIIIMIIIRDPGAGVFLWILPNFLNTEHLKTTASSARLISTWRKASLHQISQYLLVKKNYGGRKVFLSVLLAFQKKPCLCFMNRIDSLKQVHHFDAHNSNQKNEKEKRKHSVYNFSKYMQYYKIF